MTVRSISKKAAVMLLAMVFTFVTVVSVAAVPAFAASKPAKVIGVKAVAKSASSIKITWKKASGAKKYQVYRATSKNGKYKKIKTTSSRSFLNKGLKSGKKYYYKVRGIKGSKKGKFSVVKSATTKRKSSQSEVKVDTASKTVTINAKVNGEYFMKSTRHLIIDQNGFNKGKSILTSFCSPKDLYDGLVKAGGVSWSSSEGKSLKNGEKITKSNAENENYSHLDISIRFDGETYSLSDVLTTKKAGSSAPKIDMVFSGNPKAAAKTPSGCVVCLDSCYIGIASNCEYGLCDIDDGNPTVYARSDVLPDDGTIVQVIFKIK